MKDIDEFNLIINDITHNDTVQEMNNFRQHYNTTCYEHSLEVAYYSYLLCKKYNLDYVSCTRAAMLHDLFLYDWRINQPNKKRPHGFTHPRIALNNSMQLFNLNPKEQDIILKHMWPITIIPPKYKESYIVTLVDKYCTLKETFLYYAKKRKIQKIYRYAFIFLTAPIFFR